MNVSDLLHDAVDEIEPTDRLAAIREQVAEAPTHAARPWWYAAGGVVLATAAAVTAFAVLAGDGGGDVDHEHDHVATPSETRLVAAYFLGETARGERRLFREFDEAAGDDPLQAALDRIEQPATDPDYSTPWTTTSFGDVMIMDGVIHVEVEDAVLDDELAWQQVVYTLQGAAQERLPVRIGDTTYEAVPQSDVLNPVSISDPADGSEFHDTLVARGRANVYEGTVAWEVRDESGQTVREGFTTALGTGDRLYPWEAEVDLSGLPAGFYEFVASSTDPSGGAEQSRLDSDTRRIIVR